MRPLTDVLWARLATCLPLDAGKAGRPFADHRHIIEGINHRYRTGSPWEACPARGSALARTEPAEGDGRSVTEAHAGPDRLVAAAVGYMGRVWTPTPPETIRLSPVM
jgi:hypothetical protein